jgi:hypothetical protein
VASTCARAAEVFNTPLYREMVYNCISQDLSWAKPAIKVGAAGWFGGLFGAPTQQSTAVIMPLDILPVGWSCPTS